jgi:hypothetical protein
MVPWVIIADVNDGNVIPGLVIRVVKVGLSRSAFVSSAVNTPPLWTGLFDPEIGVGSVVRFCYNRSIAFDSVKLLRTIHNHDSLFERSCTNLFLSFTKKIVLSSSLVLGRFSIQILYQNNGLSWIEFWKFSSSDNNRSPFFYSSKLLFVIGGLCMLPFWHKNLDRSSTSYAQKMFLHVFLSLDTIVKYNWALRTDSLPCASWVCSSKSDTIGWFTIYFFFLEIQWHYSCVDFLFRIRLIIWWWRTVSQCPSGSWWCTS